MPARVTARSARPSTAVSHKSSMASLNPRASIASRISANSDDAVPEETPNNALRSQLCLVFRDAQRNTASHRKLTINLRKIHEACCYEPTSGGDGAGKKRTSASDFEETDFNDEFVRCVVRVMPVKKSEAVGEKTIRFVGLYLRYASDKDNELATGGGDDEDASVLPETRSTRLISRVMEMALPLLTAKDKVVRYRATQLISHTINSLDAIDDDLFQKLRQGLLRRVRDKEAMVRAQAVLGLGRLAGNQTEGEKANSDDNSDGDASGTGLLEKLLEVVQNDPSPDVRRSLLVNLPILPNTLPYLLERARDQDPATRRAVYSRLLPALGDFRHLSLSMREKLLRWGLRDRDENVRKAAGRLFRERWVADCAGIPPPGEGGQVAEAAPPTFDGLLELLERIDVVNSGVENGIALEAMRGFWDGRPDYRDAVEFDDGFWETLSAESVFMARSFNDFCREQGSGKFEALLEEKLPEVTKLAFYLERYIKVLVDALQKAQETADEDEEDDTVEQEFIVEQLLHIALTLDYSDEVGRRKMFALLRQTLSIPDLPDEVTKLTVDVLRDICAPDSAGEREFCSVVLEAVADVHDTIVDDPPMDDDSFHSAKSEVSGDSTPHGTKKSKGPELSEDEAREKAIREIMINMKCLHIVQCMLSNVSGSLQQNDHLVAMLNNLVVPAVRSHEAPVRERGLVCLGLCSLLDRSLAEENLTLFMHFFSKGHAALQMTALHILTDILNVHGAQLLTANPALLKVYVKALRAGGKSPEVQAAATVAASKLLLGRIVTDAVLSAELLKTLVVAYFDPASATNQSVRQALNYFLPVFCYSRPENQDLMRTVSLDALHALYNIREGVDDDADVAEDMVALATIGACLVDWTDPRKCFASGQPSAETEKRHVNGDVHLDLARDILERLAGNAHREEKKALAPLLGKLYVSPASSEDKIRDLYEDCTEAIDAKLVSDATGKNALFKIQTSLGKIVNTLNESANAANATVLGGGGTTTPARRSASRSVSVVSTAPGAEDRTSMSVMDEEDDEGEEADNTVVAPAGRADQTDMYDDADSGDVTAVPRQDANEGDSLVSELLTDEE